MNTPALVINSTNHRTPIPTSAGLPDPIEDTGLPKSAYLIDLNGVLVHGQTPIAGAVEFINRLNYGRRPYLILTNNSRYTQCDLQYRLQVMGFDVGLENIYSSATPFGAPEGVRPQPTTPRPNSPGVQLMLSAIWACMKP